VRRLRQTHGNDGKRVFVFPTVESSQDPAWQALDDITLKQWLEREGYTSPTLHWYLNYCCRDDYGTRYDQVSAWAGLHYYCSRWGQAANAGNGAWLTWPGGMQPVATAMEQASGVSVMRARWFPRRRATGRSAVPGTGRWPAAQLPGQGAQGHLRHAAVCGGARGENIADYGFDLKRDTPAYAPWMVANFLLKRFPDELPHAPLCWDNVVYQRAGSRLCRATHQDIRVRPPEKTVFSATWPCPTARHSRPANG
jgi:hypothetical protein